MWFFSAILGHAPSSALKGRYMSISSRAPLIIVSAALLFVAAVPQWWFHYEYRDFEGHRHVKTFECSQDDAQGWKLGDVGNVLFDPRRPTDAVWLGRKQTQ
jgi:hypothetical protein